MTISMHSDHDILPDIRSTEYPVSATGYPAGYRIAKKAGYPVQPSFFVRFKSYAHEIKAVVLTILTIINMFFWCDNIRVFATDGMHVVP